MPTIFNDIGRVRLVLAMKDPGGVDSPTTPTTANYITLTQYHVRFIRSDGRNVQGVDVPYAFDGGMTLTVGPSEVTGVVHPGADHRQGRSAAQGAGDQRR